MPEAYDIDHMSGLDADTLSHIKALARRLFSIDAEALPAYLLELINIIEPGIKDKDLIIALNVVYANEVLLFLCEVRQLRKSELYDFLRVLNHLPVLESSAFYAQTLEILTHYFRKDPQVVKLFDQLQMLYLFVEFEYDQGARELERELSAQIDPAQLHLYTLLQLSKIRILNGIGQMEESLAAGLRLTHRVYHAEGAQSTIFLFLQGLGLLRWMKHSELYKAMLYQLFERIRTELSLNSATVAYEIFELGNRLVNLEAKMELYDHLISYPEGILNARQLRALHFFAGNYNSSDKDKFRQSILSFKASNYYLHKCWERLVGISKYLRTHNNSAAFKVSAAHLEKQLLRLSRYASMRNNCYVENLEASFDEIDLLNQKLEELSITDSLTGLKNRRFKDHNLPQLAAFAARHNTTACFAMMDIDLFKLVNDNYSHSAGDSILKQLASMMQHKFRKSDIIIRYGGDEFLIVLFDTSIENAHKLLQDFKAGIAAKTFKYHAHEIRITVSIGLVAERMGELDLELDLDKIIERADLAMYDAKNSGRNQICRYNPH